MAKAESPRLFLVDGSGYIFRAYHALPPLTRASDGMPVGAIAGFCNMLWKFMQDMKASEAPTHLAVIFDKSEDTFRNKLYPEYKANRAPAPEDLIPQFPLIRDAVRAFNVACIEMDGYEADDIIATYARQAAKAGAVVKIISSDKDLMQLIEDGRIELYDPMKNKPLGPEAVMEKFGVTPDKVIDVQALIGDSVDNVPGAPGIGPKTAAELIGMFGTLEAILERAGEIKQPKRRETLQNNKEQILLSKQLVTLCDTVELEHAWQSFTMREPEPSTLLQFVDAMEFRSLARRVRETFAKEKGEAIVASYAPGTEQTAASPPPGASEPEAEAPFNAANYVCIRDIAELTRWIGRARDAGAVALDVEADKLDATRAEIIGISLAIGPSEACYIPLAHGRANARAGDLFASEEKPLSLPPDAGKQIDRAEALAALKALFEDPGVVKISHNIKFDLAVLARAGVALAPIDDPMLMSYAVGGGLYDHDRESLAERLLGHKPLTLSDVAGKGKAAVAFFPAQWDPKLGIHVT